MAHPNGLFSWTDLALPDPGEGSRFYTELFGWTAADRQGPADEYGYTVFAKDGKPVAGLGPLPADALEPGIPPMWTSYVAVDDLAATVERWTAAGGSVLTPPMVIPSAGEMAVVADPEGAVLALWQAGEHAGAELFDAPGSLIWNELNTRDSAAARGFYGEVFGWGFERFAGGDAPAEYWLITLDKPAGGPWAEDPYNGGILTMDDGWPAEVPAHWMVYFHVADIDETIARLERLGGSVSVPAFDTPVGRMAVVGDPQGGTFSIIAPPSR
ncbi:MAG TPA: VOC family protein [Actinobacteria bacterium]|nr:VOC family protein [Actinomycetota bacterium]